MNHIPPSFIQRLSIGFALLAAVILVGTTGFMLSEGWSVIDALFTTVLVISTLGFSDLHPIDTTGRVLTIGLILAGVGTLYYFVSALAQGVIENQSRWGEQRRMDQQIARLRQHYIVCGYGRVGQESCRELVRRKVPFVVVDADERRAQAVMSHGQLVLVGDATDDEVLRRAHVQHARGLLTAVATDSANVYITLSARALNPSLFIVARATTQAAEQKLLIAGANRVILPYVLGGQRMAGLALRPTVLEFLDVLVQSDDLEMWLEELRVTESSTLAGLTLQEAELRRRLGVNVLAIKRGSGQLMVNPPATLRIEPNDTLVVLGTRTELAMLNERG